MASKAGRVGARKGLSAKKSTQEKLDDLRNGKVAGLGKPTKKPTNTDGPQSPDPRPEPKPTTSDCGGWGGVTNQKTNSRGGRRGR